MRFQGFWLCLGLLSISVHAELMGDDVERTDFDENSGEIDVNEDELSSEVRLQRNQL